MGCFLIVPVAAAIAAMALNVGTFLGFLLAGFTTVVTSLAALLGLVMLV
ncbi:hypothetical protein ACFLXM_01825 [Chloroflexota bacterium]